jgi:hypothetical protein
MFFVFINNDIWIEAIQYVNIIKNTQLRGALLAMDEIYDFL